MFRKRLNKKKYILVSVVAVGNNSTSNSLSKYIAVVAYRDDARKKNCANLSRC
jgi:hypothetical protein